MSEQFKKIVFFDRTSEVDEYLRGKTTIAYEELFIATKPHVLSYLRQKGFRPRDTAAYFTNMSHEKAIERSREMIEWLRQEATFSDIGLGIRDSYKEAFIFWARFTVNYCLWAIEIVTNAIEAHGPDVICASSPVLSVPASKLLADEEYFGLLVKTAAAARGIKFEAIPIADGNFGSKMAYRLFSLTHFLFRYTRFKVWQYLVWIIAMLEAKDVIFFTSPLYQMGKLMANLKGSLSDARLFLLKNSVVLSVDMPRLVIHACAGRYAANIIAQKRLLEELVSGIRRNENIFSMNGVPLAGIISERIEEDIMPHMIGLIIWSAALGRFVDLLRPKAFLSNGTRDDDIILAEICKGRKIGDILISHGSHVPPKDECERIEWGEHGRSFQRAPFSNLALQTPLAEAYHDAFPTHGIRLRTGPLIWGKPAQEGSGEATFKKLFQGAHLSRGVKVVMHAATPKRNKRLRFHIYETLDEYIRTLQDLARAVEKIQEAVLVIKFRPFPEITTEDVRTLVGLSDKVVLSIDESFGDLLSVTDLLISFSSTTIEEALQNRIPVLLYGGGGRYQHIQACGVKLNDTVLPKAIYHAEKCDDLEYAVSKILDLKINNDEYSYLFEPYIYPEGARISLGEALKAGLKK